MSPNIKVAFLIGRFPQLTQTFVIREIFWIRDHNVDAHIFSLFCPDSPPDNDQIRELMPLVRYSPHASWDVIKAQFYFIGRSPKRYIRAFVKLLRYTYREPKMLLWALTIFPKSVLFARQMKELEIDHIHVHFVTLASIAAGIAETLLGISSSIRPHAVGLFTRDPKDVQHQLEDTSRIVTISSYHRAYIASSWSKIRLEEIEVVHCSLETDQYYPITSNNYQGPVRILSVGRLIEKKGYEYLIDACALLAQSGISFKCHIVGDGPLLNTLQAQINRLKLRDQITLHGALEQTQVLELYQKSDIFVLACVVAQDGNRDGLPVVLIEAMSCELPVVTTRITGIVDLVHHEKTGLYVDERDPISLANAVKRLIENQELRRQLGMQARQKVLQDFEIQQSTRKLASIFHKVVSNEETRL